MGGIAANELFFAYPRGGFSLSIPSLEIKSESKVAIVGPSGSGKTTLLSLLAGIKEADRGELQVGGVTLKGMSDNQRRLFRLKNIGFVFQAFELLEYLNVTDNVLLPYRISSHLSLDRQVRERAATLLRSVGLAGKETRSVLKLSQGERQRVAICRALLSRPAVVLADEPTGNLDPENKGIIMDLLFRQVEDAGATLVTVTHDREVLKNFDRVIDFAEYRQAS